MKSAKRKLVLLTSFLAVLILFSSGCAFSENSSETPEILSFLFHQPYLDAADISVYCKSDRKNMPDKIASVLQNDPVYVKVEDGGLFGKDYYAVTSKNSKYLYYGETKDNRPNGFGVLAKGTVNPDDLSTVPNLIYAGDFKKGLYNGYGASFNEGDEDSVSYCIDELIQNGYLNESYREIANVYLRTYVTYDGTWKEGVEEDKGNFFLMDKSILVLSTNVQSDYWGGSCYPHTITVTELKKGYASGDTKQYTFGCLTFDGKTKNGQKNGQGTSYFLNGQKEYDGNWKDDSYDGKGTLYDEDGTVLYSGKWKDGDYAS